MEHQGEHEELCIICMCPRESPKKLATCGHEFCASCIEQCFQKMGPKCPCCGVLYGRLTGNQPPGIMSVDINSSMHVPGYEGYGCQIITYSFAKGIQGAEHPHPGTPYSGTVRNAILPNCPEGRKVAGLLRKAFDARLVFTVGRSATTGRENQVTWNDIHHKSNFEGGPANFGFPDPTYLSRVQEELASKGIV